MGSGDWFQRDYAVDPHEAVIGTQYGAVFVLRAQEYERAFNLVLVPNNNSIEFDNTDNRICILCKSVLFSLEHVFRSGCNRRYFDGFRRRCCCVSLLAATLCGRWGQDAFLLE